MATKQGGFGAGASKVVLPARAAAGSADPPAPVSNRGGAASDVLVRDALRAYARLYRSLDFDEPDVSANVSYAVCRLALERRAAAEPWIVPTDRAGRIERLVRDVLETNDPRTLAAWFQDFPEQVLVELERRAMPLRPDAPSRRAADRAAPAYATSRLA